MPQPPPSDAPTSLAAALLSSGETRAWRVASASASGVMVRLLAPGDAPGAAALLAFCPFSQMGHRLRARVLGAEAALDAALPGEAYASAEERVRALRSGAFATLVGTDVDAVVTGVDARTTRASVVVAADARAAAAGGAAAAGAAAALASLSAGDVVDALVLRVVEYGAFVDVAGASGLIHVSEIAWGRTARAADVLSTGQSVRAQVLEVDAAKGRISLSMKRLTPNPATASLDDVLAAASGDNAVGVEPAAALPDAARAAELLLRQPGVGAATVGRAYRSAAYSANVQLLLESGVAAAAPGAFTVVLRKEFTVQEIAVSGAATLTRDAMKAALSAVAAALRDE
jgi:predicted RNA-binding protein with RPS1 domain